METILEWQAPEHAHTEHGRDWFWILGIVALSASVLSIYFGNTILGILIAVSALTLGLLASKKPRIVDIKITGRGIIVGDIEYPFSKFSYFWIEEDHMHGERLLLHPLSSVLPITAIIIGNEVNLDDLHSTLSQFMDEVYMKESALHRLFDYIGF